MSEIGELSGWNGSLRWIVLSRTRRSKSAAWLAFAATLGVCVAQTGSTSSDSAARVTELSGQVSVLRDSQPWALGVGDSVRTQSVIITGPDGFAVFQVSDGSTFQVFPNSRVTFRNNPGNWKDLLDMWIGRVKVHIQKWGGQPNNNNVRTPTAVISVRGTVFDVAIEDNDDTTFVMVEEGQVAVEHRLKPSGQRLLNPGEWLRVYKDQPLAQKSIDRDSVVRAVMRAASDALTQIIYRNPRGPSGPTVPAGSGGGAPADKPAPPPPPPPSSGGSSGGGSSTAPPPPPAPSK